MAKPKYLVVVESPAKAKTINRFLGKDYDVVASVGHVRDLPKNNLAVDIENNFEPRYVVKRDSSKAIKEIHSKAKKAEEILLATDPDREGEAIGWHIAEILKKKKVNKPISRIVFNEITRDRIRESVKKPREIDQNLVNAQQARRVLDRLVGYKLSPMLQWRIQRGLSAGRVQSVALRMVCEREKEIREFVPREYWSLHAEVLTPRSDKMDIVLSRRDGKKIEDKSLSREDVDAIIAELEGAEFKVSSIQRKETLRRPAAPFITSTLQQEASRKLRFSPSKTNSIAQQLYEGISLGKQGPTGLITYMRTDSTRIAAEAVEEVRGYIHEHFKPAMLPDKPNVFRSKKGAQDAHEAIRPTSILRTPESVAPYLQEDQLKLYTLIWKRFLASQMAPAIWDETTVSVTARQYDFLARGRVMKFPGFTVVYTENKTDENDTENGDQMLPEVREGEILQHQKWNKEQHFTKPPARYSDASLIRALEENGIGRPSTYASTIRTIVDRGYVEREKGRLYATELGEEVNELLVKNFPDIVDVDFTAHMEDDLDHIEEGKREWHDVLRTFYQGFSKALDVAEHALVKEALGDEEPKCPKCGGEMELRTGFYGPFLQCRNTECDGRMGLRKKAVVEETDEVCDKCGAPMVIRRGRFGRFLACSKYPACKNTCNLDKQGNKIEKPEKEEPVLTDQKCPDCGGMLVIRKNRRNGEAFYGCQNYPKCKFAKPMELDLKCPAPGCDGNLVTKRKGRQRFIGCDRYPDCKFTISGKVDKEVPCPKCGNSWTVVSNRRNKLPLRQCPVPECGFEKEEEPQKEE